MTRDEFCKILVRKYSLSNITLGSVSSCLWALQLTVYWENFALPWRWNLFSVLFTVQWQIEIILGKIVTRDEFSKNLLLTFESTVCLIALSAQCIRVCDRCNSLSTERILHSVQWRIEIILGKIVTRDEFSKILLLTFEATVCLISHFAQCVRVCERCNSPSIERILLSLDGGIYFQFFFTVQW